MTSNPICNCAFNKNQG